MGTHVKHTGGAVSREYIAQMIEVDEVSRRIVEKLSGMMGVELSEFDQDAMVVSTSHIIRNPDGEPLDG